jgi:hypothetical protein
MRSIVSINDPLVLTWVKMRLLHCSAGDWFCDMPAASARHIFADFLKVLELCHLGLHRYSLRRGKATHHFCKYGQMKATLVRGRWESSRTARIYLTEGMAALQGTKLTIGRCSQQPTLREPWLIVVVVKGFSDWPLPKLHEYHIYCAVHSFPRAAAAAPFPRAAGGVRYFFARSWESCSWGLYESARVGAPAG